MFKKGEILRTVTKTEIVDELMKEIQTHNIISQNKAQPTGAGGAR